MATQQEQQHNASQAAICRLEWVSEAIQAARRYQELVPQVSPVEWPLQDIPDDVKEVGA